VVDRNIFSLILAGGRGRRMGSSGIHKVCYRVGGVPVILRALSTYEECGISNHIIVIGQLGEQIIDAVSDHFDNVSFVYQAQPRGTGHAARCGARLLEACGYQGAVLVAMGDRLLRPEAVRRLIETFHNTGSDVALLVGPKQANPSSGRVVYDDTSGDVVAIVETSEIALSRLVTELEQLASAGDGAVNSAAVWEKVSSHFPEPHKARQACGELYELVHDTEQMAVETLEKLLEPLRRRSSVQLPTVPPRRVAAAEVEELTEDANLATYLFRAPVLYEALRHLNQDNAQGEEFLTDAIKYLAAARDEQGRKRYRTVGVPIKEVDEALTFNTRAELAELERHLRLESHKAIELVERPRLLHDNNFRTVAEWHTLFATNAGPVQSFMRDTYGADTQLHDARRIQYLQALEFYAQHYGINDRVFIVRSPGRLNLMGRHIDHRGGFTNVVAISEEIVMVCRPREDDIIELHNTNGQLFTPSSFSIQQLRTELGAADWLQLINSPRTLQMVKGGRWDNYVKAAALRLQDRFADIALKGVTIITHGTIPIGAGLSSSSAVVVGAAEALVAANSLPVHPNLLVDLCGEGEWFVGTRGGANDHAAIKFGTRGQVVHLSFLPFEVRGFIPFLPGHCVVVCNSGIQAKKSEKAREIFNSRILGYAAGEIIFKHLYPQFADRIRRLRDINCRNLGVSLARLYEMLMAIPQYLTRSELLERYGPLADDERQTLERILATLADTEGPFAVRGVMLFGLAECERSEKCIEYLRRRDAEGFGRLWYVSHDGDRVVSHDADLRARPWDYEVDDAYLQGLITALDSGEPAKVAAAQLQMQPGKYACSTPQLDLIVDIVRRLPGVKGAQMAGAGLGGCVMILVEDQAADNVIETLQRHDFQAQRYAFVEGAGLVVM